MTETEYEYFQNPVGKQIVVCTELLQDKTPRTLIWGYTCERHSFHVYLDNKGTLNKVVYKFGGEIVLSKTGKTLVAEECVPDKRVYPQHCDFEFCKQLQSLDVNIPFTTYEERGAKRGAFRGEMIEDLTNTEVNCKA